MKLTGVSDMKVETCQPSADTLSVRPST